MRASASSTTLCNLALLVCSLGFPDPQVEYAFAKPRKWRFDLAWPPYWLAFEREGATWTKGQSRHTTGQGYHNDVEKYNEAAIRGWCLLRATADMIQDGSAWSLLERALRRQGWKS
jgi:hypothetical protein